MREVYGEPSDERFIRLTDNVETGTWETGTVPHWVWSQQLEPVSFYVKDAWQPLDYAELRVTTLIGPHGSYQIPTQLQYRRKYRNSAGRGTGTPQSYRMHYLYNIFLD